MYNIVTANCNKNAETINRNIQLTEKRYAAMMKLMQAKKSKTIEQPPIPRTIKALPRFIFMTTPTHSSFSVSGNSLEYLIGISPEIMAYGYHRGINECYAGTSSESSQIKEEHELEEHAAFQLHKAVVRHSFRKIRLHRTLNEAQVVVLKIAECTEMEIQQNGHDFTVGQRRLTTSTLGSAIVFK